MADAATTEQRKAKDFSLERANHAPPTLDASAEDKAHYALARYAVQNDHYAGLYRQWAKALFFLTGKHWLTWNTRRVQFELDTDVPEWRQQPVTNYTYAIYRAAVSKLTKQRPKPEVVPPSGDSDDREAAKLGESILDYLWRTLNQAKKLERAIGWVLATSTAYLEVGWDPEAGETKPRTVLVEVPHPDLPEQTVDVDCACDEQGEPLRRDPINGELPAIDGGKPYDVDAEPERDAIGEISFKVADPLCVRLNPEATSEEDADEMYVATLWPIARVEREFSVRRDEIMLGTGEETEDGGRADFEQVMSSVTAAAPDPFTTQQQARGTSQDEGIGERALVVKYYAKPCDDYPEGRHWITAGVAKVWPKADDPDYPNGEAPLPFGFWPPLIPIIDTPVPGQPHGIGLLSQVVPLNEQLNYLDGKIQEYHVMMAMGGVIWVAPEDKNIEITTEPGQVKVSKAYGKNGRHPVREKLEGLPAGVYNERTVIENKLRIVAGMSNADLAQRPEGVTSGRGILALQEASDAPLMPTLASIEGAIEEAGRRMLIIAQQNYTDERTIKIRGDKGKWEFRSFKGADLCDGLDVRVQTGSSFPWSKAAQWDSKLSVLQALPQLVIKPDGTIDKEELAHYLDSGVAGMGGFESDEDPDLLEIDREHAMFEAFDPTNPEGSNQLPQLAVWQNLPKHLEGHYRFMKRDFARFERWSDPAKLAFIEHMQLTAEAVDQLAAAAAGMPAPGAEPLPGEAPADGSGGGSPLQLVAPGGAPGQSAVPTAGKASPGTSPRLTRGDFAAAGQVR